MNKARNLRVGVGILVSALAVGVATASTNGKPFVELEGQIVEVQGQVTSLSEQIDALAGEVSTVEERLDADEAVLLDLSEETAGLEAQVTQTGADLQDQIDANYALIGALEAEIDSLYLELQQKQDLIQGNCPAGSSIREIMADGSVVCEPDDVGGGAFGVVNVFNGALILIGNRATVTATCPAGYVATGAGQANSYHGVAQEFNKPGTSSAQWSIRFINDSTLHRYLYTHVRCVSL